MKIQSLAVLFIIIILPISLVLASYTQNRVDTINLQTRYDSKLNDATYDALKAYQLNSFNSDTSDYTNSKIRNIKASANTFFNSMASGFSELGYTKETLQNYVPAIVYTMYDGYYIYSPYTNTWDYETVDKHSEYSSYHNNEKLYGLKPYVYYSCRYKKDNDNDVVITYSLDNYIQIQGKINEKVVSKAGYLLSNVEEKDGTIHYNDIEITKETLYENININGIIYNLPYIKKNGTKYYWDDKNANITGNENIKVFSVLNGKVIPQSGIKPEEITQNQNAIEYYKQAYNLKEYISENLNWISTDYIIDENGQKIVNDGNTYYQFSNIFDFTNQEGIESATSNFNTHRIEVIKHSIERNLSIAISNFNEYSSLSFQMPKLKDTDWDKIMDNISIISFLQGVNIGGKIYNGYSIVTNTKNEDIVMEDSIYILTNDKTFHRITEDKLSSENIVGIYNINLERRTAEDTKGNTVYYFPVYGLLSYNSIVTQNKIAKLSNQSLYDYVKNLDTNLKKEYYTALGRERYGLYRKHLEI